MVLLSLCIIRLREKVQTNKKGAYLITIQLNLNLPKNRGLWRIFL